jgi:preprotein translocase SecF subunit
VDIGEVRGAIDATGLPADSVQTVGDLKDREYSVRVQDAAWGSDAERAQVTQTLQAAFGQGWIAEERFDAEVGARMTIEHTGAVVPIEQIQAALIGLPGVEAQEAPDENTFYVRLPSVTARVEDALRSGLPGKTFERRQVDSVGPKVGGDLRKQGAISIIAALAIILVYVAFRFDMSFAPGAVLCLFHDVSLTIGLFVILQRDINVSFIGALLTIVGYSINDTIVVYDRIREVLERFRRKDMGLLINQAINQTLGRTLGTSLTTIIAMIVFLVQGGSVIEDFALAMVFGIVVGTYSSIYVAAPLILVTEDLKPWITRLMTASRRSSPEQAAGAQVAQGGRERHGELVQKGEKPDGQPDGQPDGKPDGKPKSQRELFRDL